MADEKHETRIPIIVGMIEELKGKYDRPIQPMVREEYEYLKQLYYLVEHLFLNVAVPKD